MTAHRLPLFVKRTAAVAGFGLLLGGCVVHEREERVYRRAPVREEVIVSSPPRYDDRRYEERRVEERVVEERYEPAPREAVVTYEEDLRPYGRWVEVKEYGRCWVPERRPSGWRPYTVGHWTNTDDGWCWNAEGDEADWGVVTYHYGRWHEDRSHGWIWVPGTTWAPAWVAWREGGGYSGWAPLPPTVVVRDRVDAVYVERYVPADRYVYCETRYVGEPRVYSHVVRNDVTIVNRTTNITNITVINNRVVNRGVTVEHVERSSGRHYEPVRVTEVTSSSEARRLRSEGRPVAYVPPTVRKADEDYRQRVQRRVADENQAEHDRGARREQDATAAKAAEHDRAVRRDKEEAAAKLAEHDRALRRDKEEAAAKMAEHDRGARRETEAERAERERVQRRAQDATAAQQAERDRVLRREKDAAAEKAAEHDRAVRRDKDEAAANQAEHDRAIRREQDAKAAAAEAARAKSSTKTPPPDADAERQAAHERALRRAEEARQADEARQAAADRAKAKGGKPKDETPDPTGKK